MTIPADTPQTVMYPTGQEIANIALALDDMAKLQPHAPAIIYPHSRDENGNVSYTHYTYAQLVETADLIAAGLAEIGITRGTHTVLLVSQSLEFFALAFGMFRAGIVPILIDPGLDRAALKQCIAEADPEAFIGVPRAHVGRIIYGWGRGQVKTLVTVGKKFGWGGYTLDEVKDLGRKAPAFQMADTRANELCAIVFTSGSTGIPKGVRYTHGNFSAQIEMLRETVGMDRGDVNLPTFPLFALFDPALGATTIIPDMDPTRPAEVDPKKIIEPVEDFGVTTMFGSPALLNTVSRYGEKTGAVLPTLRLVISAGAPVPAETLERLHKMLPEDAVVYTPYGATESLPVSAMDSHGILAETRHKTVAGAGVCVGHPAARALVRIIEITDDAIATWDDDLMVPPGTVGEITVLSPTTTLGYYGRDEATAKAKMRTEDGRIVHRMGDLGYLDEQGRLWYCGRKKHRVETAEGPLYTIQVEQVFNTHPQVYRTALLGVGPLGQQTPVLAVELEADAQNADKARIVAELKEIGAKYPHTARIEHIAFHPKFPVDIRHNSKIFRERMVDWAQEQIS